MTAGSPLLPSPSPLAAPSFDGARRGLRVLFLAGCVLPWTLGCKGSVEANAKASSSGDSELDFDASKKRDEAWESEALPSSDAPQAKATTSSENAGPPVAPALLGARHDLAPAGNPSPACQCLAVVAGVPTRPGLAWSSTPPQIDPKTQLVVALSSDQVPCPSEVPKASYMGYEVREADVVIQVEAAVAGRPLTQGAIVPRPMSGGKLIIESAPNLPYGKATSGTGSCSVPY